MDISSEYSVAAPALLAGGQRTVADVYEARDKARKAYEKTTMGEDGKSDLTMKVYKGWTTK